MIALALISLAVSPIQDGAVPYGARLYAAPVVRPFEPPSSFGRIVAEGDGEGDRTRRPIVAPVAVEAYRGNYEYNSNGVESAYDAGVASAEAVMDGRMGPLDGRWHLRDSGGRELMRLSLMDEGETRPLEGAWRTTDARASLGPIVSAERSDGRLVLDLGGRTLSLTPSGQGWAGTLQENGSDRPVTLSR